MRYIYYALFRHALRVRCWYLDHANGKQARSLPPALMRYRVGESLSPESFLKVGQGCARHVIDHFARAGIAPVAGMKVLDFGCGCGRILRWLLDDYPGVEFHGVDTDPDAVRWCESHLPGGHFSAGSPEPPLPYPDAYFRAVYAFSVFTHLDAVFQDLWLKELKRILNPDGVLLITVHGAAAARILDEEGRRALAAAGILHRRSKKLKGIMPGWYNTTWHSPEYIEGRLKAMFHEVRYCAIAEGMQDIVLAKGPRRI